MDMIFKIGKGINTVTLERNEIILCGLYLLYF